MPLQQPQVDDFSQDTHKSDFEALNTQALHLSEPYNAPEVASLAVAAAKNVGSGKNSVSAESCLAGDNDIDGSFINEDIPPLELGEPLLMWKTFWENEANNGFTNATAQGHQHETDLSENRPFDTQQPESDASPSHSSWSPRSFLRRCQALTGQNSLSSSEEFEVLTASFQPLRRVIFSRAGNGHYTNLDSTSNIDVEANDQHSNVVYARVIDIKRNRPRVASSAPTATTATHKPFVEPEQGSSIEVWEDDIAEVDERPGSEHRNELLRSGIHAPAGVAESIKLEEAPERGETVVRCQDILKAIPRADSRNRGRRLTMLINGRSVTRSISPIPINFSRARTVATPSICSQDSSFDKSSPLFGISCMAKHRRARHLSPRQKLKAASLRMLEKDRLSWRSRIIVWIRNIANPGSDTSSNSSQDPRSFKVWRTREKNEIAKKRQGKVFGPEDYRQVQEHERKAKENLRRAGKAGTPKNVLKDITNLRRPGYLEQNSFYKESKISAQALEVSRAAVSAPALPEGPAIYSSASVFARANWPNPLNSHPTSDEESLEAARARLQGYTIEDSPPSSQPAWSKHAQSPRSALARLESRTIPSDPFSIEFPYGSHPDWPEEPNQALRGSEARSSLREEDLQERGASLDSVECCAYIASGPSASPHRGFFERLNPPSPGRGHWFYATEMAQTDGREWI